MWPSKGKNKYPDMELALSLTNSPIYKRRGEGVGLSRFKKKKQKFYSIAASQEQKTAKRSSEIANEKGKVENKDVFDPATPGPSSAKFTYEKEKYDECKDGGKPKNMFKYKHAPQKSIEEQVKSIMGNLYIPQNEEDAAVKPVPHPPAPTTPAPAGADDIHLMGKKKNNQIEYKPITMATIKELFKVNESPDAVNLPSPADLHALMERAPDRLEPGTDILITIKVFMPFVYEDITKDPDRQRLTYNIFYHTIVLTGRNTVSDIMDHFLCDVQGCSHAIPSNEEETRSGFIFMQKAFYVDKGENAALHEQAVEEWRTKRNFDNHPKLDMRSTRLVDLDFTLGEYDLYVHNSTCEHVLQITEIRVLGMDDPQFLSDYPRMRSLARTYSRPYCSECHVYDPVWILENHPYQCDESVYYCGACLRNFLGVEQDYNRPITCKIRPNLQNIQAIE